MAGKISKPALEDDALDQVVGGASQDVPYTTHELKGKKDEDKIAFLMNFVCPYRDTSPHSKMLEQISETEFLCHDCGTRWKIEVSKKTKRR